MMIDLLCRPCENYVFDHFDVCTETAADVWPRLRDHLCARCRRKAGDWMLVQGWGRDFETHVKLDSWLTPERNRN